MPKALERKIYTCARCGVKETWGPRWRVTARGAVCCHDCAREIAVEGLLSGLEVYEDYIAGDGFRYVIFASHEKLATWAREHRIPVGWIKEHKGKHYLKLGGKFKKC